MEIIKDSTIFGGSIMRMIFVAPSLVIIIGHILDLLQNFTFSGLFAVTIIIFVHIISILVFWNLGRNINNF
jgi:hypothetical protein